MHSYYSENKEKLKKSLNQFMPTSWAREIWR